MKHLSFNELASAFPEECPFLPQDESLGDLWGAPLIALFSYSLSHFAIEIVQAFHDLDQLFNAWAKSFTFEVNALVM